MTERFPKMRVSPRFFEVVRIVAQKWNISGPVVTEMILDGYGKGSLVAFGKKAEMIEIIEKSSRGPSPARSVPIQEKSNEKEVETEKHGDLKKDTENKPGPSVQKEVTGLSPA